MLENRPVMTFTPEERAAALADVYKFILARRQIRLELELQEEEPENEQPSR